ncbi:acidic leucine-rich nuclear phosphoprotein 32 family member E-like [Entelurus aequoreus]|uniref:acidic leucine-rich nuclear phosphoprotein 32 family member E-like n=1 Tax=Entelurus aequoreus TaxID=161455 RepID=UPI002B1CFA63|nr:acidic leucine-rich nuclear phosphoprotein 32 family member E-like [Entelurus aequoreus]
MDMKKRVSLELRDRSPAEVSMLAVDKCLSSDGEVQGVTEEFKGLEVLRMVNVGLTSLSKLPSLPKLQKLEVSDNAICGGLDTLAEKCPDLVSINLSGNKIRELSSVEALKNLKYLKTLDLFGCEVTTLDDYRDTVFRLLPNVTYLDGYDRQDNEAPDSDDDPDDGAGPHGDDDDDDDDEDDEEDDGSEEDEDGEEVGLSYLMKEGIQDEEDDGDYVEEEEDDEDEDGDEEAVQGEKRKRDNNDDDDGDDDDD